MSGIMGGLEAESYDRQYSNAELYRRIWTYLLPRKKRVTQLWALILGQSLATTGSMLAVSHALDQLTPTSPLWLLVVLSVGSMAAAGLSWVFNFYNQIVASNAIGDLVLHLRSDALAAALRRDMRFFDQQLPGRVVSRVTNDTQEMGALVTLVSDSLSSLVLVVFITAVMLFISPWLTLLTLSTAPLIWLISLLFRRVARSMSSQSRRILAVLNGQIGEAITGISVAKGFRQEERVYHAFRENNNKSYAITLRQGWVMNTIFPVLGAVSGMGTAVVVYFGGRSAMEGSGVTPGDWYFFVQGLSMIFFPLTSLASFYSQLQNGLSSSERVFALLDGSSELRQAEPGEVLPRLRGEISFQHVAFSYKEGEPVFRDLSLHIPAGQSVALVGHTGAGKSSIANLLSRYYEFQQGQILVDGRDLRGVDLTSWRRQLGVILQEQLLFDSTVADNIRYGRPEATDVEVMAALTRIGAASLVEELPQGLATPVRERGSRLSQGQRQLISLARTLLEDPAILILDEATASVDPLTEVQLQRALEQVMKGRTTLVVAHRLTTIKSCDRIVALDHGQIVEEGTHEELLAAGGYYATLYNTYYRHQSLDYIEGRMAS